MDFNQFPGQWEWIALVLGGVSFLMAISPFFQMIWGRPSLTLDFQRRSNPISLECFIYNLPVKNKLLTWLGVRRESTGGIIASYELRESGSDRIMRELHVTEIWTRMGEESDSVSTPASLLPLRVPIVVVDTSGQARVGMPHELRELPLGTYTARIVICEGAKLHHAVQRLTVTDSYPYVYWGHLSS